jgi:hypothetical protein
VTVTCVSCADCGVVSAKSMRPGVLGAQSKNSFGSDIQFSSSMYVPSANMMSLLRDEPPGYRCYKLGTLLDAIRCTKTQMPAVLGVGRRVAVAFKHVGVQLPACVPPSMILKLSLSQAGGFSKSEVLHRRMTWSWQYSDTAAVIIAGNIAIYRIALRSGGRCNGIISLQCRPDAFRHPQVRC